MRVNCTDVDDFGLVLFVLFGICFVLGLFCVGLGLLWVVFACFA
jgi:hypothetical protein